MTRGETQWNAQATLWRDPAEAVSLHRAEAAIDRQLLGGKTTGDFWGLLQSLGITLLVGREYEHFVMALTVCAGRPFTTYMPLPHPSGIAVDRRSATVFIASTRNPNQIYTFRPLAGTLARKDRPQPETDERPLMPVEAMSGSINTCSSLSSGGTTARLARACGTSRYSAQAPLMVFQNRHPPRAPPHWACAAFRQ